MANEFAGSAPAQLVAGSTSRRGWLGPFRQDAGRAPTPYDAEIDELDKELAAAIDETGRTRDGVFAARDALRVASRNGGREAAEERLAEARREWEAACEAEGRVRVRRTSLGAVRADWRRERELGG